MDHVSTSTNGWARSSPPQAFGGPSAERAIILVTSLAHYLCHLGEMMFPCVLAPVLEEFGLAPHQATLLALLGYILLGAGALPAGACADAWEPRKLLAIYFVAMAASAAAVALAPGLGLLFVALTALGLAASIYHPAGLAMLSLGTTRRSRAMGINGVAGNLGIASAPLVAWMSVHELGDWRWAYGIVAGLCLVGGAIILSALSPRA